MKSPTEHSLKLLRQSGYRVQVVERWNHFAGVRQDLFNFIDLVAIREGEIVGIQTTTYDHVSHRLAKMRQIEEASIWLSAGGKIYIHGWRKKPDKWTPKKNWRWEARILEVKFGD